MCNDSGSNLEIVPLTVLSMELTLSVVEVERWERDPIKWNLSTPTPQYVNSTEWKELKDIFFGAFCSSRLILIGRHRLSIDES